MNILKAAQKQHMKSIKKKYLNDIAKSAGGRNKLAELLNVSNSNLSLWLRSDIPIPNKHLEQLVEISKGKYTVEQLKADFPIDEDIESVRTDIREIKDTLKEISKKLDFLIMSNEVSTLYKAKSGKEKS